MKLPEFFEELDRHRERVPIDELVELMGRLEITRADIEPYVAFSEEGYQRNLIQVGRGYAALILCWSPGQASPIHDHRGSACGVRVIEGIASEIIYDIGADGIPRPGRKAVYETGLVCGSYDDDTHVIVNEQPPGHELITMHVYTPPLNDISVYTEGSAEVKIWTDTVTQDALKVREAAAAT